MWICLYGYYALGIGVESPQQSEDLQRKARPAGERLKNYKNCTIILTQ